VSVTAGQRDGDPPSRSTVAQLAGPPGLARDVVHQLLDGSGVLVVPYDAATATETSAEVLVLVEPGAEHWGLARGMDIPIVLMKHVDTDDDGVIEAVLAGAEAVLRCDGELDLVAVVAEVGRGGTVLRPSQVRALAALARAAQGRPAVNLSRREGEILRSIADGKAVKQTARDLGIAPKTVENLQARLFRKLTARNRAQAVSRGYALGLL
jgi:DNA-binding NarL/FixJ family response regulator